MKLTSVLLKLDRMRFTLSAKHREWIGSSKCENKLCKYYYEPP